MDKLNLCLSSLKAVKDGHVSRTKVEAVAAASMHALKTRNAGEVGNALLLHAISSSKEQRLAALYALHEAVQAEKRKIEDKNSKQRTETRGDLSFALEARIKEVFALFRDSPQKERDQVAKILQRWSDRYVFPAEVCRQCAQQADCTIPSPPAPIAPTSALDSARKRADDQAMSLMGASLLRPPPPQGIYPSQSLPPVTISLPQPPPAPTVPSYPAPPAKPPSGSSKPSAWASFTKKDDSRRDGSRRDDSDRRDEGSSRRDDRRRSRSRPRSSHNGGSDKRSRWGY